MPSSTTTIASSSNGERRQVPLGERRRLGRDQRDHALMIGSEVVQPRSRHGPHGHPIIPGSVEYVSQTVPHLERGDDEHLGRPARAHRLGHRPPTGHDLVGPLPARPVIVGTAAALPVRLRSRSRLTTGPRRRCTSHAVAGEPEALRPGRLHRDRGDRRAERPGQVRPHLVPAGPDRRSVAYHGDVTRAEGEPGFRHERGRPLEERRATQALEGRIGVGEVSTDIAETGRAQHRIGDRMAHGVAVGVPRQSRFLVEAHPRQPKRPRSVSRVHVEPDAYPGGGPSVTGPAHASVGLRQIEQGGDLHVHGVARDRQDGPTVELQGRRVVGQGDAVAAARSRPAGRPRRTPGASGPGRAARGRGCRRSGRRRPASRCR